jgi:ribosomal protein L16 Arg81 hydroxylase
MRYLDTKLSTSAHPGEISPETIENIQNILRSYIEKPSAIRDWFCRYATTPKYPSHENLVENECCNIEVLKTHLAEHGEVIKNESSRFAFYPQARQHRLFVDGEEIDAAEASNQLIEILCLKTHITKHDFESSVNNLNLLCHLLKQGAVYLNSTQI